MKTYLKLLHVGRQMAMFHQHIWEIVVASVSIRFKLQFFLRSLSTVIF